MFSLISNDIGIDLGTSSILIYIKGRGVVLKEPSVIAVNKENDEVVAFGEDARLMLGRTPDNISAVRPLRQGVISNYTRTEQMLKYFINKAVGRRTLRKPRICVCIPSGATEVEKKAVQDAASHAGAREVSIIEEPVAAAIGAGIDIYKPQGNMIIDIGGGTSDIAVFAFIFSDTEIWEKLPTKVNSSPLSVILHTVYPVSSLRKTIWDTFPSISSRLEVIIIVA